VILPEIATALAGMGGIGWHGKMRYGPRLMAQYHAAHTFRDGWRLRPPRLRCVDPIDPIWYGIIPGRPILGWDHGRFVQAPPREHVLIVAISQRGKTATLIIPNVQAWMGPVVATSTKPDILEHCKAVRAYRGEVWVFDPTGILGDDDLPPWVRRLSWSPLRGCTEFYTATKRARAIGVNAGKGAKDANHWQTRATQYGAPLLHAAALAALGMGHVRSWVKQHNVSEPAAILKAHIARWEGNPHLCPQRQALENLAVLTMRNPNERETDEVASIWSCLDAALSAFDNPRVLADANLASECDFNPYEFLGYDEHDESVRPSLGRDHALFVVAPSDPNCDLAPLTTGLIEEITEAAYTVSDSRGGHPLDRPLLLALDEIATISPLPSLTRIIGDGGGRGIVLMASVQAMGQFSLRWGEETERVVREGMGVTAILRGCQDPELLAMYERTGDKKTIHRTTKAVARTRTPWWRAQQQPVEGDPASHERHARHKEQRRTKTVTRTLVEHEESVWPPHRSSNIPDGTVLIKMSERITLAKTTYHGSHRPFAMWGKMPVPWGLEQLHESPIGHDDGVPGVFADMFDGETVDTTERSMR
jgi:hypothetical protein